jgi:hypothetical protein
MVVSGFLQLSLVPKREWSHLFSNMDCMQGEVSKQAKSVSFTVKDMLQPEPSMLRRVSDSEWSEISETSYEQSDDSSICFSLDSIVAGKSKED